MKAGRSAFILALLLSCSAAQAQQFGAFTSFQHNEITPGLYIIFAGERVAYQWNMSIPILPHDPYNGNRSNASFWSVYMVGIAALDYYGGMAIESDSSLTGFLAQIFFMILPVISNGQLHLNLLPATSVDITGAQASAFIGWDTALFELRDIQWFRIAPKAGVACYKVFGSPESGKTRLSLGLQIGVKMNIDSRGHGRSPVIGFVTLEAGIY